MTSSTTESSVSSDANRHPPGSPLRLAWGVAALAAVAGAFADAAPTGNRVADAVWKALFAALVTVAGARAAARWVHPLIGAALAAVLAQVLLRLPDFGFHGLSSLITALVVAPLFWSAYRQSPPADRRLIRRVVWVVAAVVAITLVGLVTAVFGARSDVADGVSDARRALELVHEGEPDEAAAHFRSAADAFDDASTGLDTPWAQPARLLPLVGVQLDALQGVSETGGELATTAATTAEAGRYQELRVAGGQLDLDLVRSMRPSVDQSVEALRAAQADLAELWSPWLVPPIADRLDGFRDEIADAIPDAELAREGLAVAPDMLGGDGLRRYLVLVTDSATETEAAQPLSGRPRAYGVLVADEGTISLEDAGPIDSLVAEVPDGDASIDDLMAPTDFPATADRARALYAEATGQEIDGVIATDAHGLAAFLLLTGDVRVEGLDQPLSAETALAYLQADGDPGETTSDARSDGRLSNAAAAIFVALTKRELPGPLAVGEALGPVVDDGRLRFWTFDTDEQQFLGRLGVT